MCWIASFCSVASEVTILLSILKQNYNEIIKVFIVK